MNLIDENLKLKLIKGSPLLLKKTNAFFQHKTVGEIIDFGYTDFLKIFHFFTLTEEDYFTLMQNSVSVEHAIEEGYITV